jgi:hypothetical protein
VRHPYGIRHNPTDRDKWRRYTVSGEHRDANANRNHTNEYVHGDRNASAHRHIDANGHAYANSYGHNATGFTECALATASPEGAIMEPIETEVEMLVRNVVQFHEWDEETGEYLWITVINHDESGQFVGLEVESDTVSPGVDV